MRTLGVFIVMWVCSSRSAWAFEPVPVGDAGQLVGKSAYVAASFERLGTDMHSSWVLEGTAFTVASVAKVGRDPAFWTVAGKTADGRAITVPLYQVSRAPLAFDLTNPGPAAAFVKNVFLDAEPLAARITAMFEQHDHRRSTDPADAAMLFALNQELIADAGILKEFTGRLAPEAVLAEAKYKWVVDAKDTALYDLLLGKGSPELRKRVTALSRALDGLEYGANDSDLTSLTSERELRVSGLRQTAAGAPHDKVAQAEHDLIADYDKRMKAQLDRSKKELADAAKLRATVK